MELFTLSNGLRVVAEQLPYLRSVSVGLWMHVGSAMERPEENGLSHFMEHMVFKGTERRTTRQIAEEMDAHGGQLNAFTARDCTCFYAKVIDEDLELAVDMLSDMALHAAFLPEELEKERGVVLEEIAMDEDSPEDLVGELLNQAQFAGMPEGQPILGTADRLLGYSRDSLVSFRSRHYAPAECVLSVCGSFRPDQLRGLAEEYLGSWYNQVQPPRLGTPQPLRAQRIWREKDTEQMHLSLGYPGYPYGADEGYAAVIMNSVLGGAMSSRLFQRIREELGMAYSIASYPSSMEGSGALCLYAGVSPKNALQVLEEMTGQVRLLRDQGMTEKEFREAKNQLRVGFLMGLESPGSRMQSNGRRQLILGETLEPDQVLAKIEAITPQAVQAVTEAILSAEPCLSVVGRGAEKVAKSF